ncbi:aspartate kinase [Prolixibacteraceae bacterium JC049]|nr:aspartate kinase [Prolixibacteraceae bacterium JC049]
MKVFKFGGASVKDADGVRNLACILNRFSDDIVVVVSAMGKTTNAMEVIVKNYFEQDDTVWSKFEEVKGNHLAICNALFENNTTPSSVLSLFEQLEAKLKTEPSVNFDYEYDQIVCFGELLSTTIISEYLNTFHTATQWIDIRKCLKTDGIHRDANINWQLSQQFIYETFNFKNQKRFITQGFLGATTANITTTLGREGSDFTAAIIANILDAEAAVIWKDVPGILNADPQYFEATKKLDEISYKEAIEMTFSGAKVIHPKTLKPLENKNIPLHVKSFIEPEKEGTIIKELEGVQKLMPIFILKQDQVLLTASPKDLSFMQEEAISQLFSILAQFRVKVNLVQHSAISFSIAIDKPERNFEALVEALANEFEVKYNEQLDLITIRYYDEESIDQITKDRSVFVEQKTRNTGRFLLK